MNADFKIFTVALRSTVSQSPCQIVTEVELKFDRTSAELAEKERKCHNKIISEHSYEH